MQSEGPRSGRPTLLLLGPGRRLEALLPLLEALGPHSGPAGAADSLPAIERLEDSGRLLSDFPEEGVILLDPDAIPLEDVGLVRRFAAARPRWRAYLCGDDPRRASAARLAACLDARWLAWPPDVEQLRALLGARAAAHAAPPAPSAAAPRRTRREPDLAALARAGESAAAELGEIEAILGRPPGEPVPPPARAREAAPGAPGAAPNAAPAPAADAPRALGPPSWYRDQIADLADLALRIELALGQAREAAEEDGDGLARRLEELEGEVFRLAQFTRTLGYLATPPSPGSQRVELAPLLEETLAAQGGEDEAPRFLLRAEQGLAVRVDKALLAQALDAVLFLVRRCAGPEGAVRVEARRAEAAGAERVEVRVAFPAGPLADLSPEHIVEPYALQRRLPGMGNNALAAARGIVRGQRGELELRAAEGGLEWRLVLPLAN